MQLKFISVVGLITMVACAPRPAYKSNFVDPTTFGYQEAGPENAAPGTCWGRDETPATIETVTQTIIETPEERTADGTLVKAATYRSRQFQRIVTDRDDIWFETPCADAIGPEFVAALQRALVIRGLFSADVTGQMDKDTVDAVRAYQRPQGLNSGQLSLVAARKLGLIPYARDDISKF